MSPDTETGRSYHINWGTWKRDGDRYRWQTTPDQWIIRRKYQAGGYRTQ